MQRDLSQALVSLGEVKLNRNDLEGGLSAYQESLSYAQLALEVTPDDLGLNRDVANAYERVGDVLFMMGRRDEARDAYDAALKVSKDLLAKHPDDPPCNATCRSATNGWGIRCRPKAIWTPPLPPSMNPCASARNCRPKTLATRPASGMRRSCISALPTSTTSG